MKTKYLLIMIAGLAIALFSCKSDKDTSSINEELNAMGIYIPRIENNPDFEIILSVCKKNPWTWYYLENELAQIKTLFDLVPESIKAEYDKLFLEWEKTWSTLPLAYQSAPRPYANRDEYRELLKYCQQFDKSIWAVVFGNFATKVKEREDIGAFCMSNLWIDLTFSNEYEALFDYLNWFFIRASVPETYAIYSRNLLKLEYDNILQSIKDNFYPEE